MIITVDSRSYEKELIMIDYSDEPIKIKSVIDNLDATYSMKNGVLYLTSLVLAFGETLCEKLYTKHISIKLSFGNVHKLRDAIKQIKSSIMVEKYIVDVEFDGTIVETGLEIGTLKLSKESTFFGPFTDNFSILESPFIPEIFTHEFAYKGYAIKTTLRFPNIKEMYTKSRFVPSEIGQHLKTIHFLNPIKLTKEDIHKYAKQGLTKLSVPSSKDLSHLHESDLPDNFTLIVGGTWLKGNQNKSLLEHKLVL